MRYISLVLATCSLSACAAAAQTYRDTPTRGHAAPQRQPYSFYPENTEGGVSGNLPFNNQIRKHTEPLNANGSR